jgi:hypothetical protein
MRRRSVTVWCLALSGASISPALAVPLSGSAPTAAPGGSGPSYAVAADCPTQQAWNQALRTRLPEELRAAGVQRFSVTIRRERTAETDSFGYTGQVAAPGAAAGEARRVSGASCQEVVEALSLIAALALRGSAPSEGAALESPEFELSPAPASFSVSDAPPVASAAREAERLRVGVEGFVQLQSISSPRVAVDRGLGVTLSWQRGAWQPWLLLGVDWGGEQTQLPNATGMARFDRWSAQLVGCPLRFPRQSALGLRPCLHLELGELTGRGVAVKGATSSAAPLVSSGAGLRLEWLALEQLALGAELDGVLMLTRPRFYFAPEFTALELPAWGLRGVASANLSF